MGSDDVIEVGYDPSARDPNIPIEVIDGAELNQRIRRLHPGLRQRLGLHLLIVCISGSGEHEVDGTKHTLQGGQVLHLWPGQTQRFVDHDNLVSTMVLWPDEFDPRTRSWFPGSGQPTSWELQPNEMDRLLGWIHSIEHEQPQPYVRSGDRQLMLRSLLTTVLAKLDTLPGTVNEQPGGVPLPYFELRELLERHVFERPSVGALARELGYSTRTLDRACRAAIDQTAKQVIDDRIAFELRRQLADPSRPLAQTRSSFGFTNASAFAKFARRHVGQPPSEFRAAFVGDDDESPPS